MKSRAMPFVLTLCLSAHALCRAGEFAFLPDEPGAASAVVEKANAATQHGLPAPAAAAYNASLQRFVDALLAQKTFKPLRGARAAGYFRASDARGPAGKPVPGFGFLRYYPFYKDQKTGKTVSWAKTNYEVSIHFNEPGGGLSVVGVLGAKEKIYHEPEPTGSLGGFRTFKTDEDNELIVLGRSGRLPWTPYTQEEYILAAIRHYEKEAAENPYDPLSPQIAKAHRAALERMTPAQRGKQARQGRRSEDFREPDLADPDSKDGVALVKAAPDWSDPKLPREAIQLATLRFWYYGGIDLAKPGSTTAEHPAALRMYDTLHASDWKAIGEAVLPPGR